MTTEQRKEENNLIAEFMGGKDAEDVGNPYKYHEFWDCLMPVVEKIELIPVSDDTFVRVDITTKRCRISGNPFEVVGWQMIVSEYDGKTKIEATYQAVVKFIRFYNTEIKEREVLLC